MIELLIGIIIALGALLFGVNSKRKQAETKNLLSDNEANKARLEERSNIQKQDVEDQRKKTEDLANRDSSVPDLSLEEAKEYWDKKNK